MTENFHNYLKVSEKKKIIEIINILNSKNIEIIEKSLKDTLIKEFILLCKQITASYSLDFKNSSKHMFNNIYLKYTDSYDSLIKELSCSLIVHVILLNIITNGNMNNAIILQNIDNILIDNSFSNSFDNNDVIMIGLVNFLKTVNFKKIIKKIPLSIDPELERLERERLEQERRDREQREREQRERQEREQQLERERLARLEQDRLALLEQDKLTQKERNALLEEQKAQIEKQLKTIEELNKQILNNKNNINSLEKMQNEMKLEKEQLESKNETLTQTIDRLELDKKALERKLINNEEEFTQNQQKLNKTQQELENTTQQLEENQRELVLIKIQLESVKKDKEALEKLLAEQTEKYHIKLNELNDTNETLLSKLTNANTENASLKNIIKTQGQKLDDVTANAAALTKANADALTKANDRAAALDEALTKTNDRAAALDKALKAAQEDLANANSSNTIETLLIKIKNDIDAEMTKQITITDQTVTLENIIETKSSNLDTIENFNKFVPIFNKLRKIIHSVSTIPLIQNIFINYIITKIKIPKVTNLKNKIELATNQMAITTQKYIIYILLQNNNLSSITSGSTYKNSPFFSDFKKSKDTIESIFSIPQELSIPNTLGASSGGSINNNNNFADILTKISKLN